MSHIEILIPFGLPPVELAADLLRDLHLPALATLLSHGSMTSLHAAAAEEFARALPHEAWLAQRFGMQSALQRDGSPPLAAALMQSLGLQPEPGYWFIVQPVHLHIARDHLVLTDVRQLALTETEARALFATAQPAFAESGLDLQYGSADYWFVFAERHRDLRTATPDATCGHNIDIWMPQGESARAWRKLQNEVQMDWHTHAVNDARSAARTLPVNSLWLWGGAEARASNVDVATIPPGPQTLFGFSGWQAAFGHLATASQPRAGAEQVLGTGADQSLLLLDALSGPALSGDWSQWLQQLQQLECDWFAPLLAALAAGRLSQVSLLLGDSTRLRSWSASRLSLRKFWIKPTLKRLLP